MNQEKDQAIKSDQYFTQPYIAKICIEEILSLIENKYSNGEPIKNQSILWIEPSAGNGSFSDILLSLGFNTWAGDLHPKKPYIKNYDYLSSQNSSTLHKTMKEYDQSIIIGNPPFGKKSKIALQFINKSLKTSGMVGFILPIQFRKWLTQKQVVPQAKLILDKDLPYESFSFMQKTYGLRCCFQVWTTWKEFYHYKDLRLQKAPETKHEDFESWQYNCTQQALKYFDYPWDIAILRQGYGDFSRVYTRENKNEMSRKKQWIFIKAHNKKILTRLKSINFIQLSHLNTGTPGFGKADLVQAYKKLKNST